MAESNATILIPDISGFTEFMTTTELSHASHAINILIDVMLKAVDNSYEVSEIEGDAVLLIKKGPAPSKKEILGTCLEIFNAFHFQRLWMQQYTICPCGACQALINLTLKFVAHHGPLAEIKIGNFVKQSGPEMIVAHRLLKNSIDNHEYLLLTEKLLSQSVDSSDSVEMEWTSSSEEYASIGKVEYRFTLLNEARKKVAGPPLPQNDYRTDNTTYLEIPIAASCLDAYMLIMEIPSRPEWVPGMLKAEQEFPTPFVGSIHHCTFEDHEAIISPLRMTITNERVMYAESHKVKEPGLSLVYEFVFKKTGENTCSFAARFLNTATVTIEPDTQSRFFKHMQELAEALKAHFDLKI